MRGEEGSREVMVLGTGSEGRPTSRNEDLFEEFGEGRIGKKILGGRSGEEEMRGGE